MSALRTYPEHKGYPGMAFLDKHMYCQCNCNKSGDANEPNQITEACETSACPCHDENLERLL